MKRYLIFFPVFLTILAACSHSTTSTNTDGETIGIWTIPGIGTTYVFQGLSADSTPPKFDTITLLKIGQQLGSKTNVEIFTDSFGDGTHDIRYYNIEANGDFDEGTDSLVYTDTPIYVWNTFPTGSRQTINVTPPVDSFDQYGNHIISSDVRSFVGSEKLTTPAGDFSTLHVREVIINGVADEDSSDYWFATSIGLYVKETIVQNGTQSEWDLIKYLPH